MFELVNILRQQACKAVSFSPTWFSTSVGSKPHRECRRPPCGAYFKLLDACPVRMGVLT
jgi:hypothetical protein